MTPPPDIEPLGERGRSEDDLSFVRRLHERYGRGVDPEIQLQSPNEEDESTSARKESGGSGPESSTGSGSTTSRGLYEKLSDQVLVGRRYQVQREIARGGMGAIIRVWDEDIRRNLAMKVMHGSTGAGEDVDQERLGRFLEEAQITGQLDHPGVVPVHDLGIDPNGRCYFTMRLVRGRELKEVLDLTREGKEGWTITKALGLILKVCEAMAYAHSKGVVHRDLKPSNVMVGRFGEVYVMDWGLARVVGLGDETLPEEAVADPSGVSLVRTVRREESDADPESPLLTMDGDVVGTPSFMAVEQAQGRLSEVGPRSDVYSLGGILYFLLSGRSPYVEPGERVSPHTVLGRVLDGPPVAVSKYAKDAPAELIAICEKAMSRYAKDRYASMLEVAEDIQAFLENRVVRAYEGGALAEFRKWVARNRGMAAATAALALLTIASAFGFAWQKGKQVDALSAERAETEAARREAEASAEVALASEARAERSLELALQRKAEADENARSAQRSEELARRSSYKANVVAASFSLRLNDVKETHKRLDACDASLRGWEWEHLELKVDPSLVSAGPFGPIEGVTFLADGTFASLSRSGLVRVHDLSGAELRKMGSSVSLLTNTGSRAMSVSLDGTRFAVLAGRTRIKILDGLSGSELQRLEQDRDQGPVAELRTLAFHPDGKRLASGSEDGSIQIWSLEDGTVEERLSGHTEAVRALAWDAWGTRLVSASDDGTARLYDLQTETELVLAGHQGAVLDVAFSPDGKRVASCSSDQQVILWSSEDGTQQKDLLGHEAPVTCLAFDPSGARLASGSSDDTVRLWNLETGQARTLRGHVGNVSDVAFRRDGAYLVSGSASRYVKIWDARGESSRTELVGSETAVNRLFGSGYPSGGPDLGHQTAAMHPDGDSVAVGEANGSISIWSALDGALLASLEGHEQQIRSLAYSPDGKLLLSGSFDKTARIWDLESGRVAHVLDGHEKWVSTVAFAPDGTWCVTGSGDRLVRVWDARSGELIETTEGHGSKGWVMGLAVLDDGERFVSSGGDKRIKIWRRGQPEAVRTLIGHTRSVSSIALHPNGKWLLSSGLDTTIRMWDLDTGEELFEARGHHLQVDDVCFHPDGSRFASASMDDSVRIWDSLSGDELLEVRASNVRELSFTPDGERLLLAAGNSVVLLESKGESERIARFTMRGEEDQRLAELVSEMFNEHFFLSDVLLRLATHPDLDEEARERAEMLARLRGDDAWRLDWVTRPVFVDPGRDAGDYALALRRARAACEIDPRNAHLQCTLGAGLYRNGDYAEAISILQLALDTDRLRSNLRSGPGLPASALASRRLFLAMSLHGSGDVEAGRVELGEARGMIEASNALREAWVVIRLLDEALGVFELPASGLATD